MTTKNSNYILDTGTLTLYFAGGQPGYQAKQLIYDIIEGRAKGYISEITVTEYFYKSCAHLGLDTAKLQSTIIRHSFKIVPLDEQVSNIAAELKCKNPQKISLADSYAGATAIIKRGRLLTTDEPLSKLKEVDSILLNVQI